MSPAKRRRRRKTTGPPLGFWCAFLVIALLAAYLQILAGTRPNVHGDRLRIDGFVTLAEQGRIRTAHILDQDAYVVGKYVRDDDKVADYNSPYLKDFNGRERLLDVLLANHIETTIDQQLSKRLLAPANAILPALLIVVVMGYLIMSSRRGTGLFATRSGARRLDSKSQPKVTFADVAGQEAAIVELKEIGRFLSDPDRYSAIGAQMPKGILLFGPPGCGKTLLARAVAGEAGAEFYSISGSDFVELYVGVGAARVRELFSEARANAPAIVFIDELDSVGRRRSGAGSPGSSDEQEQALNQILTELDGFSPLDAVIVMGATNRPDVLDPALLRPGRFDRTIGLERPDEKARRDILAVHAKRKKLAPGTDLDVIARRAVGLSGADLANVMNEAALLSARAGRNTVAHKELDEALRRILEAPERQRRLAMRDRSFARSTGSTERVTFDDVAGVEEAIAELSEVKQYLAEPSRFAALGARPPRGFLVVGPPGCGKTLLARAVAAESNASFFPVSATEFVEAVVGEGAARVRDLFAQARSEAPAVVFLDEIDAIGARRGTSTEGHREREQTLNQILIELDGFDARSGVIALAASNRPEILDPALVRAGRFDRTITINLPDRRARRAILAVHAGGKPLAADADLDVIAGLSQGYSGADLANLVNEAALLAVRGERFEVGQAELEHALERVGLGVGSSHSLSDEEREMVAYHEAGHALVGRALPGARLPHRISMVARGKALGLTWNIDEEDRVVYKRSVLVDQMSGLLGGRAAEELVFGEPGTGACDDLARVRRIALGMVRQFGMSERLGPMSMMDGVGVDGDGHDYSEESARTIDAEARALVQQAYDRALAVLTGNKAGLARVAKALLERETISREELDVLLPAVRETKRPAPRRTAQLNS